MITYVQLEEKNAFFSVLRGIQLFNSSRPSCPVFVVVDGSMVIKILRRQLDNSKKKKLFTTWGDE